jgi:hypothetical protein
MVINKEERVLAILPKNDVTETRVVAKIITSRTPKAKKEPVPADFFEIREYWYVNGPTEEPVPTKKGTMIRRAIVHKAVVAILSDLRPDDVGDEFIAEARAHLDRLAEARAQMPVQPVDVQP